MNDLQRIADIVRAEARPLEEHAHDYDALFEQIGDARVVLLGEATHGTHEFYRERARITQRLITEKGFTVVAVEADWPDAYRVNRWIRGAGEDGSAAEALGDFQRFPTWMWRNAEILNLVDWLREYNQELGEGRPRVGFYGLDLYSMYTSISEVLRYLEGTDPEAAERARYRYGCFEHFGEDPQAYGYTAQMGITESCQDHALQQLVDLRRLAGEARGLPEDELFYAQQNARLVKNAEEYYRSMFSRRDSSWNLRDCHMADTLDALLAHFGPGAKAVVWEHNSHIGDARATQMGAEGEWTVGQLVRERRGDEAFLLGFTTHTGTVAAASNWDSPVEHKQVRPSLPESYEAVFHATGIPRFYLSLREGPAREALMEPRLERAIGVIYAPRTERVSHYFEAVLPEQFDAVVHWDETRAVQPLDPPAGWPRHEPAPDTFPSGL
ncbi:MAG: Erythromycin esterase homolog [uncultured Gemmatimonadetes bacterium]|uniref:Erythromycin esterase homolog n=1 Tax=uncultured Gemmatimonadota bacterium TaxID=203437 RepID=A0A6J4MS57_9BACT|nr:MAG: Erythromycin esterase homolog [uncultured Gemmatimonadota bacterium]